ncbi:MAG: SEC-C metal-binding domain-containing protein [Desulfotomaculaceae bacterium]|nr:SEC-C metal-binding domain-containing protein [Desulfotomaculaceae bacterium]
MSNQISNDELGKIILEEVKKISIENAIPTAPLYSLAEILALNNVTALRKLAKSMHIKNYSKLNKSPLISSIVEVLQQTDNLCTCLLAIDEVEWDFFQRVAARKHLQTDYVNVDSYQMTQGIGLLQSFYFEDKLFFVVPVEIKAAYRELATTGFPEEKRFRDLLNNYAVAAVSLYGAIRQDDFVALFNSQNNRQTGINEMFTILLTYVYMDMGYCFWDEYIVDADFEEDDFQGVPRLLANRKGKPRYTPPRDEFLKYSDWDYYEVTPQIAALQAHLSELISDPGSVLDLLDEIHDLCAAEARMQEYFDLLGSEDVVFEDMEQASVTAQLIVDVQNNTRLWSNYGHTPRELFAAEKSNLIPFPTTRPRRVRKTGRNEPCPCGSGKKYKNCCGR